MSAPKVKYTKLKKIKANAKADMETATPYTSEVASSTSSSWIPALSMVLSLVAIAAAAAGITMGTLGFIDARKNNTVINDIVNNYTNDIYVNSTIYECCNNTNSTEGGVNVTAGPGINITYLSTEEALIVNDGIRNITAGANANIDYTDPHEPVISCTGGTSNITTQGLFTIVDVDVTAAELASGGVVTLFTPSGSDVYIIIQCVTVTAECVDFTGGGGDRTILITSNDGTTLQYSLPDLYALSTFETLHPVSAYNPQYLPYITQPGESISATYEGGTTDWSTGTAHIRLYLLNTNAMSIGGSGDSIVYVKDVSITAAGLASGGQVTILDNTDPAGQYEIIAAYQSAVGGIDFSGGGGDYTGVLVTDGTSDYISLDTLNAASANGISGGVNVLLTTTSPIWTPTIAGADLYAIYDPSSGTTDFTTGEIKMAIILRKIAGNNAVGVQAVLPGAGISVDSSNPQYPVVSTTGGSSNPTAVLYANGNAGELFFLSNRGGNYGLYPAVYQIFLSNNQSIQTDGTSYCYVYDSAIDSSDNMYITGSIQGTGTTFGPDTLSNLGYNNQVSFIARTDASTNWNWAIQSTASSDPDAYNIPHSICLDSSNNAYITGYFLVDSTFGATTLTTGASDITMCFVAKADAVSGWTLAFQTTSVTSQAYCEAYSIYVDNSGNIYITGYFYLSVTFGSTTLVSAADGNTFVAKADSTGTWLWAIQDTAATAQSQSSSYSISASDDGNIYIGGGFRDEITLGSTTLTTTDINFYNPFIAKVDASAGTFLWAFDAVSGGYSQVQSMIADTSGNLYTIGYFDSTQLVFGSITLDSFGVNTVFVAKADNTGTWVWAATATNQYDVASGLNIAIYNDVKLAITGNFNNGIVFADNEFSANGGSPQMYTATMDTDGNWIDATTSSQGGTSSQNYGIGCNFASDGSIYTTGKFSQYIRFSSPLINAQSTQAAFIVHINADGPNVLDQYAMLASSGSTSATVSFATYGAITGAVSPFAAGSFYYYDADAGALVSSVGPAPLSCDCRYLGFALSSASFLMAPESARYIP
jgi:hypothetical protein